MQVIGNRAHKTAIAVPVIAGAAFVEGIDTGACNILIRSGHPFSGTGRFVGNNGCPGFPHPGFPFAVDLTTGTRTILSDNTTPDIYNPFSIVFGGITVDSAGNRALVTDLFTRAVFAVDLTTGARTILSNDSFPDTSDLIESAVDITFDSINNRILVTDSIIGTLLAIHSESGQRVNLSK